MKIRDMFADDINRKINGVVKVDEDRSNVIAQEVKEYVITNDIRKDLIEFFDSYGASFQEPTSDIGVWISGFFGSGKSHFLKMLSYLLKNTEVAGKTVEDYFREKFDDEAAFMPIAKAIHNPTDTILFNIDTEGPGDKSKTAVLHVFAKMFYNYLGFYGENLKVAKLEQYIHKQGKTEEFRRVFQKYNKNGGSWLESREVFGLKEDAVVPTLQEVLGMSEASARDWFNGTETAEISISQLVSEIKEYVDSKPDNFRLVFMADEVGQYVGDSLDLLLNLQSLVEEIGSKCHGKVWIVCTGQEAIDEVIKTRQDEFSRIQARFHTRISLTSASADEVIQKRILRKKDSVIPKLEEVYGKNDSVLRNLFTFTDARQDIKGYTGASEFVRDFPFVSYQFILLPKVFTQIRQHGNSGKNLSRGERSMLSGFQEAAQKIEEKDEYTLAPFYLFYDTVNTFLDSSIRDVIDRCQKAADHHNGIEPQDVDVLKLLYLIRYVDDDIKANLNNIVILMADDINIDTKKMREKVSASLDRLLSQNYIGRSGDTYNFLTNEEQDIQREINNTTVDTAAIQRKVADIVFGDIYKNKKYRYGDSDFAFDRMVDDMAVSAATGGVKLRILTMATDSTEKNEWALAMTSSEQAIVELADTNYYELLEKSLKIRRYVKQRNVSQLPTSMQDIIRGQQDEASRYENQAKEELEKAIASAQFYVAGEHLQPSGSTAKAKLDQAMECLITHVYNKLDLIGEHAKSDEDIRAILAGKTASFSGMEKNWEAAHEIEDFLDMQYQKHLPTSMADIQKRYQAIPYGWREIDIAAVCALLIVNQKVTIKYAGETIQPTDPRLPDMLRKRSEIGNTTISKRQAVSASKVKAVKDLLRDYFGTMDIPNDEDGLIEFIIKKFTELKGQYETLLGKYKVQNRYPGKKVVDCAISLVNDILSKQKDNIALIDQVLSLKDQLLDNREDMEKVESFFDTQSGLFDRAIKFEQGVNDDLDYLKKDKQVYRAFKQIQMITSIPSDGSYDYSQIPQLNGLIREVQDSHDAMLAKKRTDLNEVIRQCLDSIHAQGDDNVKVKELIRDADRDYAQQKEKIEKMSSLAVMEGLLTSMYDHRDDILREIQDAKKTEIPGGEEPPKPVPPAPPKYKSIYRQSLMQKKILKTDQDIDAYVDQLRKDLKAQLKGYDGIELK